MHFHYCSYYGGTEIDFLSFQISVHILDLKNPCIFDDYVFNLSSVYQQEAKVIIGFPYILKKKK